MESRLQGIRHHHSCIHHRSDCSTTCMHQVSPGLWRLGESFKHQHGLTHCRESIIFHKPNHEFLLKNQFLTEMLNKNNSTIKSSINQSISQSMDGPPMASISLLLRRLLLFSCRLFKQSLGTTGCCHVCTNTPTD